MDQAPETHQALLTDLYQLTMAQAYWHEGLQGHATFSLFFRKLPAHRNYILACGLETVLDILERLRFETEDLDYLASLNLFSEDFLGWLSQLRFTGEVCAVPEGTPVFPQVPLLEITAPIAEAQLVETLVMNQIHLQSLAASKAARVVQAAGDVPVADFGMRRMHGMDAALKNARAFYIAGVQSTSNVLAGRLYGIPVSGTMAHSYIQAHNRELDAFRHFADLYGDTTLLVDTYDTLDGVDRFIELAHNLGERFRVRAIRLDSGDLAGLARAARQRLDQAGLAHVRIILSGGLDEYQIAELMRQNVPVDGFGVGTSMGVSDDAPTIDLAYKLTEYAGSGRLKASPGKQTLPGRKQVFRQGDGDVQQDVIARADEALAGRPLLEAVMRDGCRLRAAPPLDTLRDRTRRELAALPDRLHALATVDPPYPVRVSDTLIADQARLIERLRHHV